MSNIILTPAGDKKPEANGDVEAQRSSLLNFTLIQSWLLSDRLQALERQRPVSPPMNAKCSGYFVEQMDWMELFLGAGEVAGKILCPNKKCGAKLGNYDWAGGSSETICSYCDQGFCINRSKVDQIALSCGSPWGQLLEL
ncbi:hypothetical protein JOM56_000281 [Amanita muscaria]